MNSLSKFGVVVGLLMPTFFANSALVLHGTRFIYKQEANAIPVTVENNAKEKYGAQFWIENSDDTPDIPFAVNPSMFTVDPNNGRHVVQVSQMQTDSLATDRESLFTINLQEIPPTPKSDGLSNNQFVMATRTIVKLLYRPSELGVERQDAESNIKLLRKNGQVYMENPTPFYFAIIAINDDRTLVNDSLTTMTPFSSVPLKSLRTQDTKLSFSSIDDYGGVRQYDCDMRATEGSQCTFSESKR
ncbi:fimbria/pilus periplasmic chaperone [Vibrio hippocampi]|uniref:Chaperone protein FaeE n=1 Tax=Vibrio hippocampi TaxID=654686 RepID=A0ABN8DMQ7_9VIBR|nr:fimbria/pilus periplasmic chaperone [Vibrio hippocampi]CAH0530012.1 Chaperone protein FaeE [Vibrio hippocampi]